MSIENGFSSKDEDLKNNKMKVSTKPSRDEAILNTIINTSVILMSTMMDAFGQLMVQTTGTMAAGIAPVPPRREPRSQPSGKRQAAGAGCGRASPVSRPRSEVTFVPDTVHRYAHRVRPLS